MQQTTVTILNQLGLHARAASRLVNLARSFSSTVELDKAGTRADAKNIMSVMLLAAPVGTELVLMVAGSDEVKATQALVALIEDRFGEPE